MVAYIPDTKDVGVLRFLNKGTPSAVFTSYNPDDISSYGNVIFEIDLGKMKSDGYMPRASKETPVEEYEEKRKLAHKIGLDNYDYPSDLSSEGIYDTTVVFYGNIPAKYLKIIS